MVQGLSERIAMSRIFGFAPPAPGLDRKALAIAQILPPLRRHRRPIPPESTHNNMRTETPHAIYLKDYTPPAWLIDTVELHVAIHDGHAEVRARLACRRNPANPQPTWCSTARN
jgi:hypothetical protein